MDSQEGSFGQAQRLRLGKEARHQAILEIVRSEKVGSQREIGQRLRGLGFSVTQPTLSRDCDELALERIRDEQGLAWYAPPERAADAGRLERLGLLLSEFVTSMRPSGNLLVLKTPRGAAGPVSCVIDRAPLPDVIATVAGEDTLLVVARDGSSGAEVERVFHALVEQHAAAGRRVDLEAALADAHDVGHEAEDLAALASLRSFRTTRRRA